MGKRDTEIGGSYKGITREIRKGFLFVQGGGKLGQKKMKRSKHSYPLPLIISWADDVLSSWGMIFFVGIKD
jgi:hypothetical protein